MSLGWVLVGAFLQMMHVGMGFLLVVFTATSHGLTDGKAEIHDQILDLSLRVVPGTPGVVAVWLFVLYLLGADARAYWWHLLPVVTTLSYIVYVFMLNDA
jgi:hypothetical protein